MADKKKREPWSWKKKLAAILSAATVFASTGVVYWTTRPDLEVIDVTSKAASARYKKSGVLKRARQRRNAPKFLKGITLHQTATRGVGTKAWPHMTAHYGVATNGDVYRIHPPGTYLFASDALNGRTLAIEVAGFFGKQNMPPAQVAGLHKAIRVAIADAAEIGAELTHIYGHRQSTRGKPFGPQRSIFVNGAKWANDRKILAMDVDATFGTGLRIPDKWLVADGPVAADAAPTFGAFDLRGGELEAPELGTELDDDMHGDLDEDQEVAA